MRKMRAAWEAVHRFPWLIRDCIWTPSVGWEHHGTCISATAAINCYLRERRHQDKREAR